MKKRWGALLIGILLPLLVGGASALLSRGAMAEFEGLRQPPLTSPGWVFPVVWTALYILMGLGSYLVYVSDKPRPLRERALETYLVQLAVNFLWSPFFFGRGWYWFSFFWLLLLLALVALCLRRFAAVRPAAGWLLAPYLLWVIFAGYLNFGFALLN